MKALLAPLALTLAVLGTIPFAGTAATQTYVPPAAANAPVAPVTVIAVRHAEKSTDDPRDPSLSEVGQARANDLTHLLAKAGVTHVFATPYKRTRDTVAPLAKALELAVVDYSPADMPAFLATLRALPAGSVAVVSGHSNTTPGVVLDLGGEIEEYGVVRGAPVLDDAEYDRLFIVTLGNKIRKAKTLELRYGESR